MNVSDADAYYKHYLNRTLLLLGEEAVLPLRGKTVAISGCGGHGGAAALSLARMGVGNFILADPHPFDEPDINRQWAANCSTLGRNKAEVYADIIQSINPAVNVKIFREGITDKNIEEFIAEADVLIDCLDISVPGAMRQGLFTAARSKGIYVFTAVMLGFGGMIAGASPEGMPLETLARIEESAISRLKLPQRFREAFVPAYMDKIEECLPMLRAPSIAVSPALLGTILSMEALLALLGNTIPGWRPPLCLPNIALADLLRMHFTVLPIDELADSGSPEASAEDREGFLAQAGYNIHLLPQEQVTIDLATDSWAEILFPASSPDTALPAPRLEDAIKGIYGYRHAMAVSRGRFAEALLCRALSRPGSIALTNVLFPTTRFHLESNGFTVQELLPEAAYDTGNYSPFKGDLDLAALNNILSREHQIGIIYIELCNNALGGQPVSMANLAAVHKLALVHGVPVVLDAARAFENAQLIKEREEGYSDHTLENIVREMVSYSDACASSCTKDFKCAEGGFVAVNNEALFTDLTDLTLAFGEGLNAQARQELGKRMAHVTETVGATAYRVTQVKSVWGRLHDMGIPVTMPCGGHAIFVDVVKMLPHLSPDEYPAEALANALYLAGGIRACANFTSPGMEERNIRLLRLAIPIAYGDAKTMDAIVATFEKVMVHRDNILGLEKVSAPPGIAGQFAAEYRPLSDTGKRRLA